MRAFEVERIVDARIERALASLAGRVLREAQEAQAAGVSRAGRPIRDAGDAILSVFASVLAEYESDPLEGQTVDEDTVEPSS